MKIKRRFLSLILTLSLGLTGWADDYTSHIVNPSFESNLDGWENDGMSPQSNSVFILKDGNVYCEKWTGKGGKVGNAYIRQTIKNLKAGTYTVKAVGQNIQEDTPSTKQKGVYLFANSDNTTVSTADDYSVQTTICDGSLTIGLEIDGATGNYVTVDNFRLTLEEPDENTYTSIHSMMQDLVNKAKIMSKGLDTPEQKELDEAVAAVETLIGQQTTEGVTEAVNRLQNATYDYSLSIASPEEPVDMTDKITNPNFENNGLEGWTNSGMWTQSGGVFPYNGKVFAEAWTWGGNTIGDCSISQLATLPNGSYTMTAIAQCIQQGDNDKPKQGAYLFGGDTVYEIEGKAGEYTFNFNVVEGQTLIGFKTAAAKGNWVCVDNFRLKYIGRNADELLSALKQRIEEAETLVDQQMNATVHQNLVSAIEAAKAITSREGMEDASTTLRECMEAAEISIAAYESLAEAIMEVEDSYNESGVGAKEFKEAIDHAAAVYANTQSTDDEVLAEAEVLRKAEFLFRIQNSTGSAPEVTTVSFIARGATGALGRSTVSGSNIMEKGFCWSTEHNPTVLDNRTTFTYDINGPMYLMQPLEPATVYYVRAYAITKDYAVGYGEERKVITLPMGTSTYWYNWGGSPDENTRIDNALKDCIYYYNNWSCTTNFNISCSYGSGTPTADCSYGGSMRVGPNASYQRTGTILHESNHGVGVGQQPRWWDTNLHDGEWKGTRANTLLQFIENNPSSKMAGDSMHMWPYGINGASEDSGWPMLYIANVMITQALHEDGLIPPGHGGCKPAYVFEQDDDTKYYITSESTTYGSGISYLTETSTGTLVWSEPEGDVTADDAYAWYTSFDPKRQLYTIRNAKSGKYFTYSSGIKTAAKKSLADSEYFHLMVGRTQKVTGTEEYGLKAYSYWIMTGSDVECPPALNAAASGKTTTSNFNIADNAYAQRWLILTAEEVDLAANGNVIAYCSNLAELIKNVRAIQETPYVENVEGADSNGELLALLDNTEARIETEGSADELKKMYDEVFAAGMNYLELVSVADIDRPFDLTFLMVNPSLRDNANEWSGSSPAFSYSCGEFFQASFDMNQTVNNLPKGTYSLTVQGFQRPGAWNAIYTDYAAGKDKINSSVYIGAKSQKLRHILDDAQNEKLGGVEQQVNGKYIPDNMEAAGYYFDQGLYNNYCYYTSVSKKNVKMGVKGTNTASAFWTIFRNFHLYYYGQANPTGIEEVESDITILPLQSSLIYDLQGRQVKNPAKGIYIMNGKKYLIK